MNENETSKMSKFDKMCLATLGVFVTGVGVSYGVYLHKNQAALVKHLAQQNVLIDSALRQTVDLVAESLKK